MWACVWAVGRCLRNRLVHSLCGNGSGPGGHSRVASRAALFSELVAAGFRMNLQLRPDELLHVVRRQLTAVGRNEGWQPRLPPTLWGTTFCRLCTVAALVPYWATFEKSKEKKQFRWADADHPHPLVIFPDHLTQLRDRVAHEFGHNPLVESISV